MSDPVAEPPAGGEPELSFERALDELDRVVARLESGEAGLEEAVSLFEEGQRYLRACRQRLGVAQTRIEELTSDDLPPQKSDPDAGDQPF